MMKENTMDAYRMTTPSFNAIIPMEKMKPLEIGRIVNDGILKNTIVMRTASSIQFEVINLTNPGKDACWVRQGQTVTYKLEI